MARTYPATAAGWSRRLRDAEDAYMTGKGHRMKWGRWRKETFRGGGNWLNAPGWEGSCTRCGDTIRVVWLSDGAVYRAITDASGMPRSFRQCRVRRPR